MELHVHHHIELGSLPVTSEGAELALPALPLPWPFSILTDMLQRLQRIEMALSVLNGRVIVMAGELDALEAQVAQENTVIDSAITLLSQLHTMLQDAINSGNPARIQAVVDEIAAKQQALADAVTANTPAA